jgi:uncharacterized membrane protein (UPF0136 family)
MNNGFQMATWSILIYGLVVLLGGLMGYIKAKSKVSLISGASSGIALGIAWFVSRQNPVIGLASATVLALILLIVFIKRFVSTRSFMPAGLMVVFSLAATAIFIFGLVSIGNSPI